MSVATRTPALRRAWGDIQRLTGQRQHSDFSSAARGPIVRASCPCCGWNGKAIRPALHNGRQIGWRCPACSSLARDRALWLKLRELTPSLPAGARILDVNPRSYTQRWFGRFNQFDYRTLGPAAGMDYHDAVHEVKLPKGVCHLVICSTGIGPPGLVGEISATLRRMTADDGNVLVHVAAESSEDATDSLMRSLQDAKFIVAKDAISERVTREEAERFGLYGAGEILVCVAEPQGDAPVRPIMGHHH